MHHLNIIYCIGHNCRMAKLKAKRQASSLYTYAQKDWKTVQDAEKLSATKKYANTHKIGDIVTKQIQQKVRIDVPKIYFYILLLVACTFLVDRN
jgi:hypothetical protein